MKSIMYSVSPLETNKSLGASFDGNQFKVGNFESFVIEAVITSASSMNGTLYFEGSIDGSSWYELDSEVFTADGTLRFSSLTSQELPNYIRVRWNRSGGTATLNVKVGTVSV